MAVFCGSLLIGGLGFVLMGRTGAAALCAAQAMVAIVTGTWFAIHSGDGDDIVLFPDRLVITSYCGLHSSRLEFPLEALTVEAGTGTNEGSYWLCHREERFELGKRLRLSERCLVASEIIWALKTCRKTRVPMSVMHRARS